MAGDPETLVILELLQLSDNRIKAVEDIADRHNLHALHGQEKNPTDGMLSRMFKLRVGMLLLFLE